MSSFHCFPLKIDFIRLLEFTWRPEEVNSNWFEISLWDKVSLWCGRGNLIISVYMCDDRSIIWFLYRVGHISYFNIAATQSLAVRIACEAIWSWAESK